MRVNNKNAVMEDEYPSKLLGEEGDSDSEEQTIELPVPNDD